MTHAILCVMTHARGKPDTRHDTLTGMTARSGRGTARQTIRVDEDLWQRFGTATTTAGTDRSAALRALIAWYLHTGPLPKRPAGE